jgi:type II secretory pathway component PulF
MKYAVRALTSTMKVSELVVVAPDEAHARRQLSEQGLYVTELRELGQCSIAPSAFQSRVVGFATRWLRHCGVT